MDLKSAVQRTNDPCNIAVLSLGAVYVPFLADKLLFEVRP